MINFKIHFKTTTKRIISMMNINFEKMTKRSNKGFNTEYNEAKGRKLNKTRRDRSHKRSWEVK